MVQDKEIVLELFLLIKIKELKPRARLFNLIKIIIAHEVVVWALKIMVDQLS
jgi:hypothetical protein